MWWPKMISVLISVSVWVITALKLLLWYDNTQLPLYVEAQSSVRYWWPAPDRFFIDVLVYVPMYIIPAVVQYVDQCCVWLSVFPLFTRYYSRLLLTYTFLMHCSGLYSSFVNSMWAVGLFQSCIEKHGDTGPCTRVSDDFLLQGNAVNATILSVFNLPSAAIWLSVRNNLMSVPFLSSPRAKKVMSSQNPAWVPDWLY